MEDQLLQTWAINGRINTYLLDSLDPDHLADTASGKGRSVGETFAHIHNARLLWLKSAEPALMEGLVKIEKESALDKLTIREELNASAGAIAALLKTSFNTGKIKGFKPNPVAFMGYLIAHEAHHRGQIALALKQSGHPIDKKIAYGMWEWGSR
jgi:uncharacterized damage-inducible protein DinB